mgnify:CR=1 FL=1
MELQPVPATPAPAAKQTMFFKIHTKESGRCRWRGTNEYAMGIRTISKGNGLEHSGASCNSGLLNSRKLSINEASTKMRLGATSLRRLIHNGQIPVLEIGGKILLLEQDIEQYLRGCHVTLAAQNVWKPRAQALPDEVINSPHLN